MEQLTRGRVSDHRVNLPVDLPVLPAGLVDVFGVLDPQQDVGQHVLVQAEADPARQVQEGDESHEVVGVMRVVPGAGVELPEGQAPGELPGVDEADVDGEPSAGPPPPAEVQVEVELLHHEAAAAVHQEGPQGRVAAEGPVLHQVENGGEEHLVQETVHAEEQEAHQTGETAGRPPILARVPRDGLARRVGGAIPQPRQPSVKHLGEIESQDVVHGELRARDHPHLLGQSVNVPDQDLQPDVDGRVENKMKHHRPTSETPLL